MEIDFSYSQPTSPQTPRATADDLAPAPVLQPDSEHGISDVSTEAALDMQASGQPSLSDSFFAGMKQYQFADVKGLMLYAGKKYLQTQHPEYDPYNDTALKGRGSDFYDKYASLFSTSESPQETQFMLKNIDEFEKYDAEVEANPITGAIGQIVGQLTSPVSFVGGSIAKLSGMTQIAAISGLGGAFSLATDLGRSQYDPTITTDEIASNAQGAAAFGAILGGAGQAGVALYKGGKSAYSKLFGGTVDLSKESATTVKAFDNALKAHAEGKPVAPEDLVHLKDYKIADTNFLFSAANKVSSFLNPESRLLNSTNPAVRAEAAKLVPTNLIFEHNLRGEANPVSVMEKAKFNAANQGVKMRNAIDTEFVQYKKDGGKLKKTDFLEEVKNHVMDIESSKNSRVINAARHISENLNEHLGLLKARGFLPEGWSPKEKYFPTQYNFDMLTKNRFSVVQDIKTDILSKEPNIAKDDLKNAADEIYNSLVNDSLGRVYNRKEFKSKFLEERKLDLSNKFRAKYGSSDLIGTMDNYYSTVHKQLALKEQYGSNDFFKTINDNVLEGLQKEVDKIEADTTLSLAQKNKKASALQNETQENLKDLLSVFEIQTGQYQQKFGRTARSIASMAKGYQYMRVMGGYVISNLPDLANMMRISAKGGKTEAMLKDIAHSVGRNFKVFKDHDDLKLLGLMSESFGDATRSALYNNLDGAAQLTKWESRMSVATNFYSKYINFSNKWNDLLLNTATESLSKKLVKWSYQLSEGKMKAGSAAEIELSRLGIDKRLATSIIDQFKKHNTTEKFGGKNVVLANIDEWDADVLSDLGAIIRDEVQRVVFTPRAGSRPLWLSQPLGGVIAQFQGFALGAWQQIVLPRMQRMSGVSGEHTRVALSALVADLMLGVVTGYTKNGISKDDWDAPSVEQSLQYAFDRSAFFSIFNYPSGVADKVFDAGLGHYLGTSHYAKYGQKNPIELLSGVTGSSIVTASKVLKSAKDGDMTDAEIKRALTLLPAQNSMIAILLAKSLGEE
jgi:hypothetical protein